MSSSALAQRRHVDRHHVEPVEQVLAKPPVRDHRLEILVRRGDHADVDLRGVSCRRPGGSRLLAATRSSLRLQRRRHLADLVEEQRAAVASLEQARSRAAVAPVNAPFAWPNSSLSSSVSGSAAQLTATNGPAARAARAAWIARATSSLPVPLSPRISTGARRRRDPLDQRVHLAHRRALADEPRHRALRAQPPRSADCSRRSAARRSSARLDVQRELLELERLRQVVVRAAAHRLDRGLDRAERGHDDHRRRRRSHRARGVEHVEAVDARPCADR